MGRRGWASRGGKLGWGKVEGAERWGKAEKKRRRECAGAEFSGWQELSCCSVPGVPTCHKAREIYLGGT